MEEILVLLMSESYAVLVQNDHQPRLTNMDFESIPFIVVMKGVTKFFDLPRNQVSLLLAINQELAFHLYYHKYYNYKITGCFSSQVGALDH